MRCPDCSKFVGLELQDPEDVSLDVSSTLDGETLHLSVSMTARVVRNCAECGQEMKEASLEATEEVEVDADSMIKCIEKKTIKVKGSDDEAEIFDWLDGHGEPNINETSVDQIEEGGGRYAKSYFGASVSYMVKCQCGETLHEGTIEDKVAASAMDELV
jgi:hypothetical protein